MTRLRPLMALLLSLLLLGAQQVAFAHMIGHIGSATAVVTTVDHDDAGHGEALTLSHVCTTCVSASGLASAAPGAVPPRLTFDGAFIAPMASSTCLIAVAVPRHYLARAPPAVL
jgi:hypothetical protein